MSRCASTSRLRRNAGAVVTCLRDLQASHPNSSKDSRRLQSTNFQGFRASRSVGVSGVLDVCLMFHSSGGHDEPEILRSSSCSYCLTRVDVGHYCRDGHKVRLRDVPGSKEFAQRYTELQRQCDSGRFITDTMQRPQAGELGWLATLYSASLTLNLLKRRPCAHDVDQSSGCLMNPYIQARWRINACRYALAKSERS
jgi:hypothetical protein